MRYNASVAGFLQKNILWLLCRYHREGRWTNSAAEALSNKLNAHLNGPPYKLVKNNMVIPEVWDLFNITEVHEAVDEPEIDKVYLTEAGNVGRFVGKKDGFYRFAYGDRGFLCGTDKKIYPLTCPREAELFPE